MCSVCINTFVIFFVSVQIEVFQDSQNVTAFFKDKAKG